jgi:hypothetical protein
VASSSAVAAISELPDLGPEQDLLRALEVPGLERSPRDRIELLEPFELAVELGEQLPSARLDERVRRHIQLVGELALGTQVRSPQLITLRHVVAGIAVSRLPPVDVGDEELELARDCLGVRPLLHLVEAIPQLPHPVQRDGGSRDRPQDREHDRRIELPPDRHRRIPPIPWPPR